MLKHVSLLRQSGTHAEFVKHVSLECTCAHVRTKLYIAHPTDYQYIFLAITEKPSLFNNEHLSITAAAAVKATLTAVILDPYSVKQSFVLKDSHKEVEVE